MVLRSFVLIVGLVLLAVFSVSIALSSRTPAPVVASAEPTLSARAVTPVFGDYHPVLFSIGKVEALDSAVLTAPTAGEVLRVRHRAGEDFTKGRTLIALDLRELEQAVAVQKAEVAQVASQLAANARNRRSDQARLKNVWRLTELAKDDHQRNVELSEQNVLSQSQLDASEKSLLQQQLEVLTLENTIADYETQARQLTARRDALEARLRQTEVQLERARIEAPFDGRVVEVLTAQGARVAAGAPLISIFDPTQLRVRVDVPQRYADVIRQQENVFVVIEQTAAPLTLAMSGFNPQIKSGSSAVETFFNLPADNRWILGESVDVILQLPPIAALRVPVSAIYDDSTVYRINADSRAQNLGCKRLGMTRQAQKIETLLRCDGWRENDRLIANQIPNIVGGAKITVIAE